MPGSILINPSVLKDRRDALAVAVNEALRLFMEDSGFQPSFEPTAEQRKFFSGTAYGKDGDALKKTILARVATFDTSVTPTDEESAEAARLMQLILKTIGTGHRDFPLMSRIAAGLRKAPGKADSEAREAIGGTGGAEGTVNDDILGGVVGPPTAARMTLSRPEPASEGRSGGYDNPGMFNPGFTPEEQKQHTLSTAVDMLQDIESRRDPDAVGDRGRAVGLLQMWKIQVDEANRLAKRDLWTYADRRDPDKSKNMALMILGHLYDRGIRSPVELAGRWRNPHGGAPAWRVRKAEEALIGEGE